MNVAIFGANGYMGRHLVNHLTCRRARCTLFDVQKDSVSGGEYRQCDAGDVLWWKRFDPRRYDVVFFLSGLSGPERSFCEALKYEAVNVGGLLNLLQTLAPLGEKSPKVVFPSSRLVYRGGCTVTEDDVLEPRSVYAANKIACEGLLSAYWHRFGVPYTALRICVPYGNLISKEYSYGTVGAFMKKALAGEPITVYGDGSVRKTYTHILDVCDIFERVAETVAANGIFNVGGFDYSLREVAELVAKSHNGNVVFVPWPDEARLVDMGDISLDASKLANAVGFSHYRRMEDFVNDI